jgi:hypothetical protein
MDDGSASLSEMLYASLSEQTTSLDLTGYAIVYDDTNTSQLFLATVKQLQSALNAATGLSIPVVPQSKRASDKTQPEILVGDTNRDASYDGRDQVQGSGFVIKKEGNKLVVIGDNELQTICAMQYLIYQFLPTHTGGATLTLPTIEAKNRDTVQLMTSQGSAFEVIYSKDIKDTKAHNYVGTTATDSTSDNRDHGELEMTALCMAVMDNGVLASSSIDYLRPSTAPTHGDDRVRVAGTDGVIEVMKGEVTLINADGEQKLELLPQRGIFYDFALHLLDGEEALVDAAQTFELTRACLVARDYADVYGDIEG